MKKQDILKTIKKDLSKYTNELERNHNNNIAKKVEALQLQYDLVSNNFINKLDYNILKTGSTEKDSKTFNNGAIVELAINNALGNKVTELATKGNNDLTINYKGKEYHIEVKSALNANSLPRITTIINDSNAHKKGASDKYIIFFTYKGIYIFTRLQLINAYNKGLNCFDTTTKNAIKLKAINLPKTFKRCYELESLMGLSF